MVSAWRGPGEGRPSSVPLPPDRMPPLRGARMLKRWRWVGAFSSELMLCVGLARIGPVLQSWWAVWDREASRLHERTRLGRGKVRLARGRADVLDDDGVGIALAFEEVPGVEVVTPDGDAYAWTRKQGGIAVRGSVYLRGAQRRVEARGLIDDSAGYHARRTAWRWSAGVGVSAEGEPVAWNAVDGVHDSPQDSERTVWVGEDAREVGPVRFADDLGSLAFAEGQTLRFSEEAARERHENFGVMRSDYVQPFGAFSGRLPGVDGLAEGFGVMERHEVLW